MSKELTDSEITEMARKSRFAREFDERDAQRRAAPRKPPRMPPSLGATGAEVPKPRTPAGGAAADDETPKSALNDG